MSYSFMYVRDAHGRGDEVFARDYILNGLPLAQGSRTPVFSICQMYAIRVSCSP